MNSGLYTPIGQVIERFGLTELPQFLHVFSGHMSLVGNRPLPARVMEVLRQDFPNADDRFLTKAGLTGVVQLVGRDQITDADRLLIEIEYCQTCRNGYSIGLDLWLLVCTVLILVGLRDGLTVEQVRTAMRRFSRPSERILLEDLGIPAAGRASGVGEIRSDASS
jgi:lipopolysaccharide/colanic/teichoic acid biosynthesis glycosyltransferase